MRVRVRAKPPPVFQEIVDIFSAVFSFLAFNPFSANWLSTGDALIAESFTELTKLNERYRLFLELSPDFSQFARAEVDLTGAFNSFVEVLDSCKTTKLVSRSDFNTINDAVDLVFQQESEQIFKDFNNTLEKTHELLLRQERGFSFLLETLQNTLWTEHSSLLMDLIRLTEALPNRANLENRVMSDLNIKLSEVAAANDQISWAGITRDRFFPKLLMRPLVAPTLAPGSRLRYAEEIQIVKSLLNEHVSRDW